MAAMGGFGPLPDLRVRPNRPWMEFVLPIYTLALFLFYFWPGVLAPLVGETLSHNILWWSLWIVVGAFGGILSLSALVLGMTLLYAPMYLVGHATRILDPQAYVDQREVRFYLGSFLILCGLIALAVFDPRAALASFILLAGFAPVVWRLLV